MKCPNCGIDNPDSATICQCGHSFTKEKLESEKSLEEQAQEIREETRMRSRLDVPVEVAGAPEPPKGVKKIFFIGSGVLSMLVGTFWVLGGLAMVIELVRSVGEEGNSQDYPLQGFLILVLGVVSLMGGRILWRKGFHPVPKESTHSDVKVDFEEAPEPQSATVTEEREQTSPFLSFFLDLYSMLRQPWPSSPGFAEFLSTFFRKYSEFLKTYMVMRTPPFLLVTIWLLGMATVIDRLEVGYLTIGEYQIDSWFEVWAATVAGVLVGYLGYWILGSWYHLRVLLSGGSGEMYRSRNLFLYTGIPLYLVTIFSQIVETFVYGNNYFTSPTFFFLDAILGVLAIAAIAYSILLSYKGVRLLHSSGTLGSITFFVALPAIVYVVMFGRLVFSTFERWDEGLSHNEQALEQMATGNYDEAERLFKLALGQMTKDDQEDMRTIHESLGLLYLNKGDNDQALKHYQEAVSRSDLNGPAYYSNSGEIKLLEGNITEAIEDFERVLELEPDHISANNNLGLIFLGTVDEDIVDYEKALPHNQKAYSFSGGANTIANLALNYYALDMYSDALPLFETLNSFSPDNAFAKYYIGLIYWENGDLTRATIFLKEAIQLDPSLYSEEIGEILGIPPADQRTGSEI